MPDYRIITSSEDEGAAFLRLRDEIAAFYTHDMGGQVRPDGPGAKIKFTRDWEYPWALLRADVQAGRRVLDCGSGFSPLPFLWAKQGGRVVAMDRDALVASRAGYAWWCASALVKDLRGEFRRTRPRPPAANSQAPPNPTAGTAKASAIPPARRQHPLVRFAAYQAHRNRDRLRRLWKPDFWGPVSPTLLRRHHVSYVKGDLAHPPFADGTFDSVTCVSVLEHLPEALRVDGVVQMTRVLRRGGRLVITYDVIDGDLTERLVAASGCVPRELVYFRASERLYARGAPDVVGMSLDKPA